MNYPPAPTTFEDLIQLIPPRGSITSRRFICADKPFELRIGRTQMDLVFLSFCAPDNRNSYWPCIRTVESLTTQRTIWTHWQKFLADPDSYLTWKYIADQTNV